MPNAINWEAAPSFTQIITDAEPASAAGTLSSAVTNDTVLARWAAFRVNFQFGTGPGAGKSFKCYILRSYDSGTTYEEGGASTQPTRAPDFIVPVFNDTSAHVAVIDGIETPPLDFKVLVWNDTGQTVTTNALQLYHAPYNLEIQ